MRVYVCLCVSVCACVHVSVCCTLIGLDRLGKVTSLPDCLDFPHRSNKWARLKYCSTMWWRKRIYGAKISAPHCHQDNSITGEGNRVRHSRRLGVIFVHCSCFNFPQSSLRERVSSSNILRQTQNKNVIWSISKTRNGERQRAHLDATQPRHLSDFLLWAKC